MMPVMDGWEFRRRQQADPDLAPVPVIVLSALDQSRAAPVDACAFLKKPLDFDRRSSSFAITAAEPALARRSLAKGGRGTLVDTLKVQVARLRRLRSISSKVAKIATGLVALVLAWSSLRWRCCRRGGPKI